MERSPLEVRGWVSGLNFVIALGVVAIGLIGAVSGVLGLSQGKRLELVLSQLVMGLGVPVGVYLFRRTLFRWREQTRDEP